MASKKRVKVKKLVASTIKERIDILSKTNFIYKVIGQAPRMSF